MKRILGLVFLFLTFLGLLYFSYNYFRSEINQLSYKGSAYLNELLYDLKQGANLISILILVSFGFLYGIFHAIGPGHGKIVLSSYFLNKTNLTRMHVIKIVSIATTAHFIIALILFLLFETVLSNLPIFSRFAFQNKIALGSGALIVLIGSYLLFTNFVKVNIGFNISKFVKSDKVIAFLAGSIPCPLTITVLLTSYSLEIFIYGMLVALSITLGLFVMLLLLSFLTTRAVNILNRFADNGGKGKYIFIKTAAFVQASIFILIGLYLVKIGI